MSPSNGKVSSDVCTRHVYPITTCVMTPVSDLVMLFFFGRGREQKCMTGAGDNIIFFLITVSGRIDAGSLLAVMGAR